MKHKLKYSIYVMIFLCSFVPICIWLVFSVYNSERRIEQIISNNIEAIGGSQVMSIQNFCEGRKESMQTISSMKLVRDVILNYEAEGSSQELDDFLQSNEEQKTYIASISVVDADFHVIGSSQKYEIYGVSDFRYLDSDYLSGEFMVGNVYERQTDNGHKRMIPFSVGIYDNGELIGYLIQEIDCDYFNRLRLQTDFLKDGTLYLLDGNMNFITAGTALESESRLVMISDREALADYYTAWDAIDHEKQSEGVVYYTYDNKRYMTYFAKIEHTDWSIRITENMSAQWRSNHGLYPLVLMEGLAVALMLICVQVMLTRKIVAPFNKIADTLRAVQSRKDYSLRIGIEKDDEVGVIAKGIDELLMFAEQTELEEKRKHEAYAQWANAEAEKLIHKDFISSTVIENMPSGYHRCLPDADNGFPFIQLGSHFEEILGWSAEEIRDVMGNCYRNLIWPEDMEIALTYAKMVIRVGSGNAYDTSVYRMKHKDGGYRWITDATMFVDMGEESFFQGVIADITPYVEGMEEAKRQAEASSHAKTDFLSQISHDIRTPMNAIVGFTNLAKKSDSYEQIQKEYIPKIEKAGNQLLMIINDVLEMNSIERGRMEFHPTLGNIIEMTNTVIAIMRTKGDEKGIAITPDICVQNTWVYCDENCYNRVMMNLLSNAIKFTPDAGTIRVTIQEEAVEEAHVSYCLQVSDTGIGIAPEFLPHVFEPFARERTSTISRVEGTGLGMAIVKNIVESAGGTISVDSVPGEGTTFTIRMTLAIADKEEAVRLQQEEQTETTLALENLAECFAGKRVLLVEDNLFNREIADAVLADAGFLVEMAEDGQIAVQKVQQAASEDYYDVILMDIQMPVMDGYQATKAIRSLPGKRADTCIIAVTANAFESDKEQAKAAGMNGHISKPIDVKVLYNTLLEKGDFKDERCVGYGDVYHR